MNLYPAAGSRRIIPSSRMFIHSDLHLADTNQPVAYSGPGRGNKRRGQNCKLQLVAAAGKTISFDVCPQVAWWCKMTHQPGGGGGGGGSDEPLEPPLDPPLLVLFSDYHSTNAQWIYAKTG